MELLLVFKKKLNAFIKQTAGTYAIMMVLLTFFLIGFIAIIVDGTGWLQDKARFTQGLEQAGLFLTAEDNQFRKNKNHLELNTKDHDETHKIEERNQALLRGITRTYYLPENAQPIPEKDILTPTLKTHDGKALDNYHYNCKYSTEQNGINCKIGGYFERTSWLYYGKDYKHHMGLTFNATEPVGNVLDFAKPMKTEKLKPVENPPMDIVLVMDTSGSMFDTMQGTQIEPRCYNRFPSAKAFFEDKSLKPTEHCDITGIDGWGRQNYFCVNCRIDMVRKAIYNFIQSLLATGQDNRLGIVTFADGAWQRVNEQLVYPYKFNDQFYNDNFYYGTFNTAYIPDKKYVDFSHTIQMIKNFKYDRGEDLRIKENETTHTPILVDYIGRLFPWHWSVPFSEQTRSQEREYVYPNFWYQSNKADRENLIQNIINIRPGGGTLSSSGVIIASNLMFYAPRKDRNKLKRIIIVLSDGQDSNDSVVSPGITKTLIQQGMCNTIKTTLNTPNEKAEIFFIQFGFDVTSIPAKATEAERKAIRDADNKIRQAQKAEWVQCTGDESHFFDASNAQNLLKSLQKATGIAEETQAAQEVGYSKNLN